MLGILIFALLLSLLYTVASLIGLKKTIQEKTLLRSINEPVISVLKPLCGSDDKLEDNLKSFFEQDYSHYELVFGVQDPNDSAIPVVKALMDRFPKVDALIHIHSGGTTLNPKVANLIGISGVAEGEILVISDSNVSVPSHYLASSLAHLEEEGVGLVTHVLRGKGEKSLGSMLNSIQMNGYTAPSVGITNLNKRPFVIGKSIVFRKKNFEKLGGFSNLGNVLAEDYILGRTFLAAGYKIVVDNCLVDDVTTHMSVGAFWKRNARWALIRSKLKPLAYPFEVLTYPIFMGVLLGLVSASYLPLLVGLSVTVGRDMIAWSMLRGHKKLLKVGLLSPLKELLLIAIWASAPFNGRVQWRKTQVYVSAGTRIYGRIN